MCVLPREMIDTTQCQPRQKPGRNHLIRRGRRLQMRLHEPFGTWSSGSGSHARGARVVRSEHCRKGNYLEPSVLSFTTANLQWPQRRALGQGACRPDGKPGILCQLYAYDLVCSPGRLASMEA